MEKDRFREESPKVIDNELIKKCIYQHGPKGEAGRLAAEEGIPFEEVVQIRFEIMKIIRIDHLWVLPALTKLSLSNNLIEKIENLDSLIHLTELDLSFNKIARIENMDKLIKLEVFTVFGNKITKLENLNSQKNLMIFSAGRNLLQERECILYLRKFKKLRSLNLAGNPCAENDDQFRTFVVTFLLQIDYYEYILVQDFEREDGKELYRQMIARVEEEEYEEKRLEEKLEAELAEAALNAGSFVEFLGSRHLFDQMFEGDEEGIAFLEINKEVKETYEGFEEKFLAQTLHIFKVGQEKYQIRKDEVEQFFNSIEKAQLTSQSESIKCMEKFLEQKSSIFDQMKRLIKKLGNDDISLSVFMEQVQICADNYTDLIHVTWKQLMGLELTLYEQSEEVNQTFELTITEMTDQFIEAAQGVFTELRNLEQSYSDVITEEANKYLQKVTENPDSVDIPQCLIEIMFDKESLNNAIGATHDKHMQAIDTREDTLIRRAREWLSNLVSGVLNNETTRNRQKVLEINHFLDIQREEFDELHAVAIALEMDPDVRAVLTS